MAARPEMAETPASALLAEPEKRTTPSGTLATKKFFWMNLAFGSNDGTLQLKNRLRNEAGNRTIFVICLRISITQIADWLHSVEEC